MNPGSLPGTEESNAGRPDDSKESRAFGVSAGAREPRFTARHSFLRGGVWSADLVTTVSPTFAREMRNPSVAQGLQELLAMRKGTFVGLLNGIDQQLWDPENDPRIAASFGASNMDGKSVCKQRLLGEVGLPTSAARPLVVSLGRVVRQKGSDLLADAIPAIVDLGASVVVAGGGDEDLCGRLRNAAAARSEHARFLGVVPDDTAHRLIAGADFVVMPSRFEPCGIVQMYAHRYGALPIARRTGGLIDTIEPVNEALDRGSGWLFDRPTPDGLVGAVEAALAAKAHAGFRGLAQRVMGINHDWSGRSAEYLRHYHRVARGVRLTLDG